MSQVAEINAKVENINQTITQVQAQIVEKQAQVEDLKQANAKLVEQNLLKQRKPPSLDVQRKKIVDLTQSITELQNVEGSLKEKLAAANQSLQSASINHRIEENRKAQDYHLKQIRKAEDLLSQFMGVIVEIEGLNTLGQLVQISSDITLNGKVLADYEIDLGEILNNFNQARLSCDFDFSRIDTINVSLQNLINQLDAIRQNRRSYHQVQTRRAPTVQRVPHVDPLRQAQLYEKNRLESENDLNKAMKGKTQIIPHHR